MQTRSQPSSIGLTAGQESLYFLNDLAQGRPVYNMPQAFRVRGPLEKSALEAAFAHLVERHPSLRAEIRDHQQFIRPYAGFNPTWQDLSGLQPEAREAALQTALAESVRAFRLRDELPFRAHVFRLSAEEHVLFFDLHHIFGDMESLVIIARDLSDGYSRLVRGEVLSDTVAGEGAVAADHESKSIVQESERAYWRDRLREVPLDFELHLDKPRPRFPSFGGESVEVSLSSELTGALKQLARRTKSSPFMLIFSAFQALIHRFSGVERFCVGTPFSLRTEVELENKVGYLVNLLPFPCEVKAEEPFLTLLNRVKSSCIDMMGHSQISLRQILQELNVSIENPKPSLTRIVFQYFPGMPELHLERLTAERIPVPSHTSKFDLSVSLSESHGVIHFDLEYDTDIFERSTVERLAASFRHLLDHLATNVSTAIGDLAVIPPEDEKLLAAWNDTATEYPREKTVHELFDETARLNPERIAIVFEDRKLTYRELNSLADMVAHRLRENGVGPGARVGVCVRRSPGLVAALIGILKAGAAFVPFDANHPKARLEYLFSDSSVSALVVDEAGDAIAPAGIPKLRIEALGGFDRAEGILDGGDKRLAEVPRKSTDLAYIMYTSGSTGNPKGVMVPHRAIVRLVRNNNFMSIGPDDVFLAFAPVSFDASTLEIWAPLLNGATVAMYPPEFSSIEEFQEVLARHRVTCLWLTSGLFNAVVDKNVEALRGVRQLLAGGDVLSVPHVRKALEALPSTQIINGYGPTENTTFTCCYTIPKNWPPDRPIPIGKPIRNTLVYLLDRRLKPVPIGVPGDLYAAGDGLSLGYWNNPELTTAAFIPNPFSNEPGARLYRTGDRARHLPDGNIEFLGRTDFQVKVRGFRIELGEVENALRNLPSVRDAVVTVQTDGSGGKSLVGYVVRKVGHAAESAELLNQLGQVLPTAACPSSITFLESLPIGPTGKVDRHALPKPDARGSQQTVQPPNNETEARLLEIWGSILETKGLGIDDNFFHFGGESLKATRAVTQINKAFKCDLTIPKLFMAPTVREMAGLLEKSRKEEGQKITRRNSNPSQNSKIDLDTLPDAEIDSLLSKLLDNHVGS